MMNKIVLKPVSSSSSSSSFFSVNLSSPCFGEHLVVLLTVTWEWVCGQTTAGLCVVVYGADAGAGGCLHPLLPFLTVVMNSSSCCEARLLDLTTRDKFLSCCGGAGVDGGKKKKRELSRFTSTQTIKLTRRRESIAVRQEVNDKCGLLRVVR